MSYELIDLNSELCSNNYIFVKETCFKNLVLFLSLDTCHPENMYTTTGLYSWPRTPHGYRTELVCPLVSSGVARRQCRLSRSGRAVWEHVELENCLKVRYL